jgi:hypothetical protein
MKKFMKIIAFALIFVVVSVFAVTVSAADIYDTSLPFSKDLLYGRNTLAEMENGKNLVDAYDKIYESVENGIENVTLWPFLNDIRVTPDELMNKVMLAYRFDNPQHFFFLGFKTTDGTNEIKITLDNDGYVDVFAVALDQNLMNYEARAVFEETAKKFIVDAGVTKEMSQYEISLRLHDAVVEHVEYDHEFKADNIYNAYGALIGKKAVCEGYAELYQYLLYLCGIQSHAVTGYAGGPHMWNLVRIDGEYYMSDPTWDDQGIIYHEYLNTNTAKLDKEGRIPDKNGYPLPTCTATKASYCNYPFYNMYVFKEQPSLENAITQLKYYGEARFHYNGSGTYTFDDFYSWADNNHYTIAERFGLNSWNWGVSALKSEFVLTISGIETIPLPEVPNIPKIAAICSDTGITVKPNSAAGDVVICPVVSGTTLSATDIQDLLNNTAVEVKELVNSKVVTGSKLDYCGEEAIIAVKGDIDLDGELSVFDANIAQKGDSSFTAGYELQKMVSDIDGNEITDATDSQAIINQIVS